MNPRFALLLIIITCLGAAGCAPTASLPGGGYSDETGIHYGKPSRLDRQEELMRMHRDNFRRTLFYY